MMAVIAMASAEGTDILLLLRGNLHPSRRLPICRLEIRVHSAQRRDETTKIMVSFS